TTNDIGDLVAFEPDVTQIGTLSVDPRVARKTGLPATDSPMIDAGTCNGAPATDVRGRPRPDPAGPDPAKCDIGAGEFRPPAGRVLNGRGARRVDPGAPARMSSAATGTAWRPATLPRSDEPRSRRVSPTASAWPPRLPPHGRAPRSRRSRRRPP